MVKNILSFALLLFVGTGYSQCSNVVGNENPGFLTPANYGANYILGVKFTVPSPGTLVSLNLFGLGTNSGVQMCLYEDNAGVPGDLVTTSAMGTVTNGPIALAVTPVVLPAGDYWQMAIFDGAGGTANHCYYTTTTTVQVYYQSLPFGSPMPPNASGFLNYCCQDFQYWMVFDDQSSTSSITEVACDSYTAPSGNILNATGIYTDTIPNFVGCDSIITIDLTINNANVATSQNFADMNADATGATYQWLDCDNAYALLPGETGQNFTANTDGNYAVEVTENGCVDTSACLTVFGLGLESEPAFNWNLFPNPTAGTFTVMLNQNYENWVVEITDLSGRLVDRNVLSNTTTFTSETDLEDGVYLVNLLFEDGSRQTKYLVKN